MPPPRMGAAPQGWGMPQPQPPARPGQQRPAYHIPEPPGPHPNMAGPGKDASFRRDASWIDKYNASLEKAKRAPALSDQLLKEPSIPAYMSFMHKLKDPSAAETVMRDDAGMVLFHSPEKSKAGHNKSSPKSKPKKKKKVAAKTQEKEAHSPPAKTKPARPRARSTQPPPTKEKVDREPKVVKPQAPATKPTGPKRPSANAAAIPESSTLTLDVSRFMPARGTAAASIGSRAMEHLRLAWQSTLKPVLESVGAEASIERDQYR